jgi:hypothetical protein
VTFEAGPGRFSLLPKNVPHRFQELSDQPVKIRCVQSPGGVEEFFEHMRSSCGDRQNRFAAVTVRHLLWSGIICGVWGFRACRRCRIGCLCLGPYDSSKIPNFDLAS